ncbi:dolichyl-diphosphooligosaccharide--protein glycosyltransferase subunit [Starmerella bacillaris]|uniref:dolichyl-diphosphooligosaccharide--protein glycotransferase n=1 Tax=Starmerella bacillaris TaxID=1247836 RepID=A0AAV5RJX0_STABA|nr:dolichyl-diphosphooligosaccharide--protein glycosyltransferase subunit [Starmerella bacillaris]
MSAETTPLQTAVLPEKRGTKHGKLLRVIKFIILSSIAAAAVSMRLYSVLRFESIIHEYDPWFNFRATKYLSEHGYQKFLNWFDNRSWYPLGRVTGGTLFPGLMVTSNIVHKLLLFLGLPVDIREVCVLFAPAFSGLTAYFTYLLTREMKDDVSGMLAALFVGMAPGYISRSVAGSYDNEAISITLLMATFYFWIKAVKIGSVLYASICALSYFYMVSAWGGYVFITNMIPLHVFVLLLMGRYHARLYTAYCTWYSLGTLASMQIPFVGTLPVKGSEHMSALGVFGLLQIVAFASFLKSKVTPKQFKLTVITSTVAIIALSAFGLVALTYAGIVLPWTGRFYSLWDTNYAKIHIPIIASVSEHQPTPWTSFFMDLSVLTWFFPVGVYLAIQELRDEHVFLIVYAVFASYFSGVMVRLVLTLTPIVAVCSAIAISALLDVYNTSGSEKETVDTNTPIAEKSDKTTKSKAKVTKVNDDAKPDQVSFFDSLGRKTVGSTLSRILAVSSFALYIIMFVKQSDYVTESAYSSPSVVLSSSSPDGQTFLIDDFREAYYWLRMNTDEDAKILSWWDYGYQIGGMADRTTLVDNNTWNNTHIGMVGRIMSVDEDRAYPLLLQHDVDYILIIFGGAINFNGDDLNKFLWMIRISGGIWPEEVKESDYYTNGYYQVGSDSSDAMRNSLLHKMSFWRFQGMDRPRRVKIDANTVPSLDIVEEAYTSANWMVRIYRVKKPDEFGRDLHKATAFDNK